MTYKTIHTTYGLMRMAQAEATGEPVNLPQIAVGDGGGNPVVPSEWQTQLLRETYRADVNRVFQDPTIPNKITAELIVPASIGGFVLREVGIFDDQGGLFAVGNLPDTYKPAGDGSEGAFADTVVRMEFLVTNAGIVTLQVDPNVAVATQTWVANHFSAANIIPGGLTSQILVKQSNADGDVVWHDPTNVNVVVTTIEEEQTLAASQTVVNLTTTNTTGLALYIEGSRLRADEWTPDPSVATRLTLEKSYPDGYKLTAVQNEPASALGAALQASKNLSDVADAPTARDNLGVYSKAQSDAIGKQPGDVFYTARASAPTGSLKANGAAISRTAYASLFAAIGTTFGAGDGFNTFNLPDLRGEFLRGVDDGRGVDTGRALGSGQAGQNASHTHAVNDSGHTHNYLTFRDSSGRASGDGGVPVVNYLVVDHFDTASSTTGITINASGGTEARPRNVALLACIKY